VEDFSTEETYIAPSILCLDIRHDPSNEEGLSENIQS